MEYHFCTNVRVKQQSMNQIYHHNSYGWETVLDLMDEWEIVCCFSDNEIELELRTQLWNKITYQVCPQAADNRMDHWMEGIWPVIEAELTLEFQSVLHQSCLIFQAIRLMKIYTRKCCMYFKPKKLLELARIRNLNFIGYSPFRVLMECFSKWECLVISINIGREKERLDGN